MKTINLILILGMSALLASCSSSKTIVLSHDLDLAEHYPFRGEAPMTGTIKAGTKIKVQMIKGSVAYISIPTAVTRKELEEAIRTNEK